MQPVELKVKTSTAAAAVSGLALYILGRYVFKSAVPDVITSWVYAIIPGLITFAAGYAAKHTPRSPVTDEQIAAAVKKYAGDLTDPAPAAQPSGTQM